MNSTDHTGINLGLIGTQKIYHTVLMRDRNLEVHKDIRMTIEKKAWD